MKETAPAETQSPVDHFADLLSRLSAQEWRLLDLSYGLSDGQWHSPKQISHQQLLPLPADKVKHQRQQVLNKLAQADISSLSLQSPAIDKLQQEFYFRTKRADRINRFGAIRLLLAITNHQDTKTNRQKLGHKLRHLKPK